jgi:hypothetical protein
MFVTKILEKKGVIQAFGVALIVAPFLNTLTKLFLNYRNPSQWTAAIYWSFLVNKTLTIQVLSVVTILCGVLMLRGKTSAWRFTLFLLAALIGNQLLNFSVNFRESWVAVLYLAINILAFGFIVDQLVWKVEPIKKASPVRTPSKPAPPISASIAVDTPVVVAPAAPKPLQTAAAPKATVHPIRKTKSLQSPRKILISFDKNGAWAQLTSISSQGFQVKCILPTPPEGIASREVEFKLKNGPLLKARLSEKNGNEYVFKYISPSKSDISHLNQWMQNIA